MKKKTVSRLLAVILLFSMCTSMVPTSVFAVTERESGEDTPTLIDFIAGTATAEDIFGNLDPSTVPEIINYEEAVANNHIARLYEDEGTDLNKVIFLNVDGSKTMYSFDFPVKYVDQNGNIRDISLEIADSTAKAGEYVTAAGSTVTTFSARFQDGIGLRGNGAQISLIPALPGSRSATALQTATATRVDEKTVVYPYDANTVVEYSLTYTGFKEDIVVSEYTGQTVYPFRLLTNGLALKEINGSFYLVDAQKNIKAAIGDIIIFTADERNNTFGDIEATTVTENQEYLLNIVVDADFLADPKTAYPIRIDPTVEINYSSSGTAAVEDITISTNTNYSGSYDYLFAGRRQTEGVARILMRFPALDVSELAGATVTSATVRIRDMMCEDDPLDVSCHVFTGSEWSESSATWANCSPNSYVAEPLSTNTLKWSIGNTFSSKHWYSFDVTDAVQGWIDGYHNPNKGLIFKVADSVENGDEILNRTFGSYNRTNYQPSLSVTYTVGTEQWVPSDTYYLNNRGTGKYLYLNTSTAAIGKSGLLASLGNRIQWQVQQVREGYVIRSVSDPTKYLSGSEYLSNDRVSIKTVSNTEIPDICIWVITPASMGGCLIRNSVSGKFLSSSGTSLSSANSIGSYGTERYESFVWRMAPTDYYGNTSAYDTRELESGYVIDDVVVKIGETKSPYITTRPYNAIWADANDFIFEISSGDSACVSFVQPENSFLGHKVGSVWYTATHKVTGWTTSFWVVMQPLLVFQTDETYWYDKNGNMPSDLEYGDMSLEELEELWWIYSLNFYEKTPEVYELDWRTMVTELFSVQELQRVANDMIDHFMDGTGTPYSNSTLTNAVVEHSETTRYTGSIQTYIQALLNQEDGDIYALAYTWEEKNNSLLYKRMKDNNIEKPAYNELSDLAGGLTICINRLWGVKVEVTEYSQTEDTYVCKLHYTFYDHFGLDEQDVADYGYLAGFRAWFILQHYSQYNGAYKPFITFMEFDKTLTGTIS